VVHVTDASRAVGVVGRLQSDAQRTTLVEENRREQERLRREHEGRRSTRPLLSLEEARRRRTRIDWAGYQPPQPSFAGTRVLDPVPLAEIVPYVDWTPFFAVWELRGTYPRIFEHPEWGARAREVFDDAQEMLKRIVAEGSLGARAVYGFFPAGAVGDDIEIYSDETRSGLRATFPMLRQQADRSEKEANQALADFVAPRESGLADWIGAFAVTAGLGEEERAALFRGQHDDYGAILTQALADRLAEALAEWLHQLVRREWGYDAGADLTIEDLIRERYRGIRPAPGYPSCPDHSEKARLFDLLGGEEEVGISLTETFAMRPAASVCGLYFAHPQARYFSLGRIERDQVVDYHRRKGVGLGEVERWLGPHLNYAPGGGEGER
jgi:5-methyltetrahydrofolate--homocysteine methyltransferase